MSSDNNTSPLTFGTAGLRAPVGPGADEMNVSTVTRATAGVASWLGENKHVAVGYDARYGSNTMALAAAHTFAGAGYEVTLIAEAAPTPVLAWLVRDRGLDAGVQITASHNPATDNGYKLFLEGGAQLLSPADREIEEHIAQQPAAKDIPRVDQITIDKSVVTGYISALGAKVATGSLDVSERRRDVSIAYTPLHGVGGSVLEAVLRSSGFGTIEAVSEQRWPDPTFPTAAFPNPEEPGTTDLLLELGHTIDADVLIALDPDADRCAIGTKNGMLTGDQLGPLLADYVMNNVRTSTNSEHAPVVATTVVSSQMLSALAEDQGWDFVETLTGFKHLAHAAHDRPGELAFAYEEAIGTCPFPDVVADKDGIATALVAAAWAADLKAEGRNLDDEWKRLEDKYGVYRTKQVSQRFESNDAAHSAAKQYADNPPADIAGVSVTSEGTDYGVRLTGSSGDLNLRVICRPSGTEAKMKFYIEVTGGNDAAASEELVQRVADAIAAG